LALVPDAEKAYTDCTSGISQDAIMERLGNWRKFIDQVHLGDLPTCIADVEALIPGVEKAIADIKAGN
jgi:hypothetical protein